MQEDFNPIADPGIAIFYEGKIGADRGFRFQTVVPRECTAAELSTVVDKLRVEADRQDAMHSLDIMLSERDAEMTSLDNIQKDMKRIAEANVRDWRMRGKQGEPKLTGAEKTNFDNLNASIVAKQNQVKRLDLRIIEARKKIAATQAAISNASQ